MMPEVLGEPPSPRTALFWNGTAWQWALVDAAGQLQVDVAASTVPGGIATAANQIGIAATLGVIDDLVDALQSNAADRLIVRGEDQLWSFKETLARFRQSVISGAGGYIDSTTPPAGDLWHISQIVAQDITNPVTQITFCHRHGGVNIRFNNELRAIGAVELVSIPCDIWMGNVDIIRIIFTGALLNDTCEMWLTGHVMTLET